MSFYRKNVESELNIWPGFVDALSAVLIVIIFIIIGFLVSQLFLSNALNKSDNSLKILQNNILVLKEKIAIYETENITLKSNKTIMQEQIKTLMSQLQELHEIVKTLKIKETKLLNDNTSLQLRVDKFSNDIHTLNLLLEAEKRNASQMKQKMSLDLEEAVGQKLLEIKTIKEELKKLRESIPIAILENPDLLKYRSEFFDSLKNLLGGRSDVRVVGDRFVFQSDVLFELGSDELGKYGKRSLDILAKSLKEVISKIPSNINWILRIDGHTDNIPIHNERFDSNWELSLARAAFVIKYLIKAGIPPSHLMAAGFAEHCPLTADPLMMSKNRRIEIRLDQK